MTSCCRKQGLICLSQGRDAFWSCRKRFTWWKSMLLYEAVNSEHVHWKTSAALIGCKNKIHCGILRHVNQVYSCICILDLLLIFANARCFKFLLCLPLSFRHCRPLWSLTNKLKCIVLWILTTREKLSEMLQQKQKWHAVCWKSTNAFMKYLTEGPATNGPTSVSIWNKQCVAAISMISHQRRLCNRSLLVCTGAVWHSN